MSSGWAKWDWILLATCVVGVVIAFMTLMGMGMDKLGWDGWEAVTAFVISLSTAGTAALVIVFRNPGSLG